MFAELLQKMYMDTQPGNQITACRPMAGVQVWDFACTPPGEISLALVPRHYEALFCDAGALQLTLQDNRYMKIGHQDILLLSDIGNLKSVQVGGRRFRGILVMIDVANARESLSALCQLLGGVSIDVQAAAGFMAEYNGCAAIHSQEWADAVFAALERLPASQRGSYCAFKALELLYLLCCRSPLLQPAAPQPLYRDPYQMDTVRQVQAYMLAHLGDRITIASLSKQFHISSTALKEGFRQQYGQPLHRYLRTKRLDKAAALLTESNLSVTQIMATVGYTSAGQFSSVFRSRFHMTPSQYRRMQRQQKV